MGAEIATLSILGPLRWETPVIEVHGYLSSVFSASVGALRGLICLGVVFMRPVLGYI